MSREGGIGTVKGLDCGRVGGVGEGVRGKFRFSFSQALNLKKYKRKKYSMIYCSVNG